MTISGSTRQPTLVTMLQSINLEEIRACASTRLDRQVGDWDDVVDCTIAADTDTYAIRGKAQSVEGVMTVTHRHGEPRTHRVVLTLADRDDPLCTPRLDMP